MAQQAASSGTEREGGGSVCAPPPVPTHAPPRHPQTLEPTRNRIIKRRQWKAEIARVRLRRAVRPCDGRQRRWGGDDFERPPGRRESPEPVDAVQPPRGGARGPHGPRGVLRGEDGRDEGRVDARAAALVAGVPRDDGRVGRQAPHVPAQLRVLVRAGEREVVRVRLREGRGRPEVGSPPLCGTSPPPSPLTCEAYCAST